MNYLCMNLFNQVAGNMVHCVSRSQKYKEDRQEKSGVSLVGFIDIFRRLLCEDLGFLRQSLYFSVPAEAFVWIYYIFENFLPSAI